ncbi:MAG: succinylglutamate desuccinylase/aspartoacylase family protein [Alteromonadaceae bacterium]
MDIDFDEFTYLKNPDYFMMKADYIQFLMTLTGPTVIDVTGSDEGKCRVFTTLLHGDEPSGLIAMHRWLTGNNKLPIPITNVRFIICSVEAANISPLFSRRYLDSGKDINRCFSDDNTGDCGLFRRALLIEKAIKEVKPEILVDLHNCAGSGPAFALASIITPEVLSMTSYFCQTIILSGLQLGSLMERKFDCPMITVKCGGSNDEQSHHIAYQGLKQLTLNTQAKYFHQNRAVDIIYKPLRLTLKPHTSLSYGDHNEGFMGVCIKSNIEQLNYGVSRKDQMIGWVDEKGLNIFELVNEHGDNVISDYFSCRKNILTCEVDLRIFMATDKKNIALNDCFFYVVKVRG